MWAIVWAAAAFGANLAETYGTVEPRRQQVSMALDPASDGYTGTSTIWMTHTKPVDGFTVYAADDMEIASVAFFRGTRRWDASFERLDNEQVRITPDKPIKMDGLYMGRKKQAKQGGAPFAPSTLAVEITFRNDYNSQPYGLYKFEVDGEPHLVTQFEADDAREAFPCVDLPDDKVSFWLELDVPTGLVALSNGAVTETRPADEEGWDRVTFVPTRPIPTYAMALAVGPYTSTVVDDVTLASGNPVHVWTVAGREALAPALVERTGPLLSALENWFDGPYPYQKLDWIAVPKFAFGGMENPGLIVLTERVMMHPESASRRAEQRLAEVAAHELAHMWFGNLVTLKWWDDFWLNESFATWMAAKIGHEVYPELGFPTDAVLSTQSAVMQDGRGTMRPVRTEVDPSRIFETANFLAYPKGGALLTMVEEWLGEDAFKQGIRSYIDRHTDDNATAADLFAALSEASGKDVGPLLGPWLDRPGAPLVHVSAAEDGTLTLSQQRYLVLGAEAEPADPWSIPMQVRWADDAGVHTQLVLLDSAEGQATLPVEGALKWVFPTADGVGYLAWNMPEDQLQSLVSAADQLTALERLALVGNLEMLTAAGQLSGGDLLQALARLSGDGDIMVQRSIVSAQGFVSDVVRGEELENAWAHYVRTNHGALLDSIGRQAQADEDPEAANLRATLMSSLLNDGKDPELQATLDAMAQSFLEDPTSVPNEMAGMALSAYAERADVALQADWIERMRSTDNPVHRGIYAAAIGRFPTDEAKQTALTLALDERTENRQMWALMSGALEEEDESDTLQLDWTIEHYDDLVERLPPRSQAWLVYAGAGCVESKWATAVAFFGDESRRTPGVERAIREGTEALQVCVKRRERHTDSVRDYLLSQLPDDAASDD